MDETIVNRLLLLMEAYGFSAGAFADKIEVQRSSISHLMSGRNKPSLDFIQKVLLQFPVINPSWLIMGKGPMKQLNLFDEVGKVAEPTPLPPAEVKQLESTPESVEPNSAPVKAEPIASTQAIEPPIPVSTPVETPEPTPLATVVPPPVQIQQPITPPAVQEVIPSQQPIAAPIPATVPVSVPQNPVHPSKKAVKIVFFYDDNTFETFYPGN